MKSSMTYSAISKVHKHLQNISEIAVFFGGNSAFYGIGASKIKD